LDLTAGELEYWDMFQAAYTAAIRHYKSGPWYSSADIWTGAHTHQQFTSLQAFWPGNFWLDSHQYASYNLIVNFAVSVSAVKI